MTDDAPAHKAEAKVAASVKRLNNFEIMISSSFFCPSAVPWHFDISSRSAFYSALILSRLTQHLSYDLCHKSSQALREGNHHSH
ncbi:hypothetical protein [Brucella intermedia]|uniref:hypothetical protein n=1 Tax=Brucella intermedia TaxID=94625 RepID=UPI00178C7787|nr:hypothetical protein [Brucella intermedia]